MKAEYYFLDVPNICNLKQKNTQILLWNLLWFKILTNKKIWKSRI